MPGPQVLRKACKRPPFELLVTARHPVLRLEALRIPSALHFVFFDHDTLPSDIKKPFSLAVTVSLNQNPLQ